MRYVYRHMDSSTSCQHVETETVARAVTRALSPGFICMDAVSIAICNQTQDCVKPRLDVYQVK